MKLSCFTQTRDNNFNLMRLMAAFTVLISHSFALQWSRDPLEKLQLDMTMGTVAVDFFFIISGFLVTASLLAKKDVLDFIWARFLRIYPAMMVMVLLCIFGLGLYFTKLPINQFLHHPRTLSFAIKNMTLVYMTQLDLPGVFVNFESAIPNNVNNSIWTLFYEVHLYGFLVYIWLFSFFLKENRIKIINLTLVLLFITAFLLRMVYHFYFHGISLFCRLFYMFFCGAAYFVLKDKIIMSTRVFLIALTALLLSTINKQLYFVVYHNVLAYLIFWLAFVPAGNIRKFNRVGDYSYGMYIYAFPVQQSLCALIPNISIPVLILTSTTVTLLLASLSWHLIEKNALSLKRIKPQFLYSRLRAAFIQPS